MQSRSTLIEHTRRPIWPAVCCLTLIFTATNFQLGDAISSEPFHHGEALAAALSLAFEKTGLYPLTIHGALDFIPALIARTLFGQEKYLTTIKGFLKAFLLIIIISLTSTWHYQNNFLKRKINSAS